MRFLDTGCLVCLKHRLIKEEIRDARKLKNGKQNILKKMSHLR